MKIGIIGINIYVRAMNYACPLHAYAFQQYLLEHGIKSEIIDYLPNTNKFETGYDYKHPSVYFNKKVEKLNQQLKELTNSPEPNSMEIDTIKTKIDKLSKTRDAYEAIYEAREERYEKQKDFVKNNLILSREKYNCAILETTDPEYDCYICVTDIIWDKFANGYEPGFFLGLTCMENKWKIAYSASKLTAETEQDKKITAKWIRDMDFVSVREDFLQRKIMDEIRTDVTCVLDPVLLHDATFYSKILKEPKECNYLLLYYVVESDPEIINKALLFAQSHHLKIIELTDKIEQNLLTKNSNVEVIYKYDAGIEEWIGYFKYANFVFTNSFHGCCLSIIFEKNFFVSRRKNYDKITALLNSLSLENRIIDDYAFETMPISINNWDTVRKMLNNRREISEHFLMNALNTAMQQKHPIKDYAQDKKKQKYIMLYNIGKEQKSFKDNILPEYQTQIKNFVKREKSIEFRQGKISNDGTNQFHPNFFIVDHLTFVGYRLRIHFDYQHFYLLEDGSLQNVIEYRKAPKMPCKIFHVGETIPYIPINRIKAVIAEAVWSK